MTSSHNVISCTWVHDGGASIPLGNRVPAVHARDDVVDINLHVMGLLAHYITSPLKFDSVDLCELSKIHSESTLRAKCAVF